MHTGKNFTLSQVLKWTFRDILLLTIVATIPTVGYELFEFKWLTIPWLPVALLGTAVAFMVGFKNNASYDRLWEARRIWGGIVNASRSWGVMAIDFTGSSDHATILIHRHIAWLTALRFQLREPRTWEAMNQPHNIEFRKTWYQVEEQDEKLTDHLKKWLKPEELEVILSKSNKAAHILALQSAHLAALSKSGTINDFRHMELQKLITELYNQQGASERIKNFPYPRQYATVNLYFIKAFVLLIPLGLLPEFAKLGEHMVWLTIPFSVLCSWIFTTMEKIGEATESPFEGGANDVPITAISRTIEIDLCEMLNQSDLPKPKKSVNEILM